MSKRKPSPAMIIAMIALCLGLGGSAIAASDLTKSQVKKIAKKQAKKQLKKNIAGSHVNRADKATTADTATHAHTATRADNATNATTAENANAVGGLAAKKFVFNVNAPTGNTAILNIDGLTVSASCAAAGDLQLTATTSVNDAMIHASEIDLNPDASGNHATYQEDDAFNVGDTFNFTDPIVGTGDSANWQLVYTTSNTVVTVQGTNEEDQGPGNLSCTTSGTGLGS